jgi:hypothetical protein
MENVRCESVAVDVFFGDQPARQATSPQDNTPKAL